MRAYANILTICAVAILSCCITPSTTSKSNSTNDKGENSVAVLDNKTIKDGTDVTKVDSSRSTTKGSAVQCNGMTQKGAQCKRKTTNTSGFCYQHEGQASKMAAPPKPPLPQVLRPQLPSNQQPLVANKYIPDHEVGSTI